MNVENPFRRGGHIGQITRDAVLRALGLARRAARVHQEQGSLRRQGNRVYGLTVVVLQQVVHKEVATCHHRRLGGILSGVPLPHQNLVYVLPQLFRRPDRDVGVRLVVNEGAIAPVTVHRNQDAAARIVNAGAARLPAEPAEHLRVDDAESRTRQHRDRQLRHHRHVEGDPVAGLESHAAQQDGDFVHAVVQLLIRDRHIGLFFRLGHENESGLARVLGQMAVHAVVRGVDLAADEPFPEWCIAGVEDRVIRLEPGQHVRIDLETVGKLVEPELFKDARVPQVRLCLELLGRLIVGLFLPMHRDLRFADLGLLRRLQRLRHLILPPSRHLRLLAQWLVRDVVCSRG